jgi:hypothetical protein
MLVFLRDKATVLWDMIKRTPLVIMVVIEMGWKSVDWIHPAHDGDQWHPTVNTVMKPILVWLVIY